MNFYEDYVQDMQLHKLEQPNNLLGALGAPDLLANYKRVMTVDFTNAYPIRIGEISLNTETKDSYTSYQVDFTYESYSVLNTNGILGQLL